MNALERKTVLSLSSIYAFRMLGLFMILPIFSLYVNHFQQVSGTMIGLALGIYGLTQALLQIPFGMTSDRIGRKPVIVFGLVLFVIGSIIAALAHSIEGIIIGRAIQGAGAVGSTLTALVADSTREDQRLKAMSLIGMTIGLSFVIAMIAGPVLNQFIGLSGIFWFTAVLGVLGIVMLLLIVPTPKHQFLHRDSEAVLGQFKTVLSTPELLRLNFGIFTSHAILTALFVVIPMILLHDTGIAASDQWMIYLPVLLLAFFAMVPFIIIAEKKRRMKGVFVGAVAVTALTQFGLYAGFNHVVVISVMLFLFFTAFTLLEASLPSLIAKIAPVGSKGTAMGVYSSCQFLGIFVGGAVGGWLYHHYGLRQLFLYTGLLGVVWVLVALTMKKPQHLSSKILAVGQLSAAQAKVLESQLQQLDGVAEAKIFADEQTAYLKIDKTKLDDTQLSHLLGQ